jgi:WD40 repeat protein
LIEIDTVAHSNWINAVAYSFDNLKIATGGSDNKIKIWDTTGVLLHTLVGHSGDVNSVKFSTDNLKLFSASSDNTIRIWNVDNGSCIDTIKVSSKDVNALEVSPDGNHIVSVSADNYIRTWNANTYDLELEFLQDHSGEPICVAWSPNENKIATGTSNGLVTLYDISSILGINNIFPSSTISISSSSSNEMLQLNLSTKTLISNYAIINQLGQTIQIGSLKNGVNTLDISFLNSGVYFIVLDGIDGGSLKFSKG